MGLNVWLTSPDALTPSQRDGCLRLLSEPERARYNRFVVDDARDQFLVGRAMLRTILSKYADLAPEQWVFGCNAFGRPHIESPKPGKALHFNLSHAKGLVCVVVSDCADIGIDVENTTRRLSCDGLAARYFSARELETLEQTVPGQRRQRFFDIWTLREAYVKARGLGMSLSFDCFEFNLNEGRVALVCAEGCNDWGERWRFFQYRPTANHVISVAASLAAQAEQIEPVLAWFPKNLFVI